MSSWPLVAPFGRHTTPLRFEAAAAASMTPNLPSANAVTPGGSRHIPERLTDASTQPFERCSEAGSLVAPSARVTLLASLAEQLGEPFSPLCGTARDRWRRVVNWRLCVEGRLSRGLSPRECCDIGSRETITLRLIASLVRESLTGVSVQGDAGRVWKRIASVAPRGLRGA